MDVNIVSPRIVLDDEILRQKDNFVNNMSSFEINRINITNGILDFKTKDYMVRLVQFHLSSFKKGKNTLFRLISPHLKVVFPLNRELVYLEGALESEFRRHSDFYKVNKFLWTTTDLNINVNGRVFNDATFSLNSVIIGSPHQLLSPLIGSLSPHGMVYCHGKISRDLQGKIAATGRLKSTSFRVKDEEFANMQGRITWDNREKRINVNTFFNTGPLKTQLKVDSFNKGTQVVIKNTRGAVAAKIIDLISIVPLAGYLEETNFSIRKGIIDGTVTMVQDPSYQGENFNVGGEARFVYDLNAPSILFSSDRMMTEFGNMSFSGQWDFTPRILNMKVSGNVSRMGQVNKYSRFYIDMDLDRWGLQGGKGKIALDLNYAGEEWVVDSRIQMGNFLSNSQNISSLTGFTSTRKGITVGKFVSDDPDLSGAATFFVDPQEFKINFTGVSGQAVKTFKILDIGLDIQGKFGGEFVYYKKTVSPLPLVTGNFESDHIVFYGFPLQNVSGRLSSDIDTVTLGDVKFWYNEGMGNSDIFIDYAKEKYRISGAIQAINLNRMHSEFAGLGNLVFKGEGQFLTDPILLDYQLDRVMFYSDKTFGCSGKGKIFTDFSDFRLEAGGSISYEKSLSDFSLSLISRNDRYNGTFDVHIKDINFLVPWGFNDGKLDVRGEVIPLAAGGVRVQGVAGFQGKTLTFPNFPQTLDNYQGMITFRDLNFTLQSLQGTIGNGTVEGNGSLRLSNNGIEDLLLNIKGRDMLLFPMDKTQCTVTTRDLSLRLVDEKLLLHGTLSIPSGLWEREIEEGISFNTDPSLSLSESKILDMLEFDLRLVSGQDVWFNNSQGRVRAKFDLKLTGNPDFPVIIGVAESREGELYFSDNKFNLLKGKLVFNNKYMIDPIVDIESEAFIKNYRIRFTIDGTSERYKPEFRSSPPLPPQDILSLISLGELFRGPTATQLSSRIGTGATGMFATEILTSQIKKGTKKYLGNYMLKVDPNTAGTSFEDTAKLILGYSISKDFLIVYSTDLTTTQKEVWYIKYQLSPSVSVVGMKNEEGRLSLDIRFRGRQ